MTLWQTIRHNPRVLTWAIVIHLLAFIAIGVSFKSSDTKISAAKSVKVIEAVAIDESKIQAEINKLKKADERKERDQKRLENKASEAKRNRKKEEEKLRKLKRKQKQQELISKNKRIKEKKLLAEVERKRKESQDRLNKLEQQRKRKESQDKLNKLEQQRKEKESQLEKEEKAREAKIAEQKRVAQQQLRAKFVQSEVAKYRDLIKSQITRNWIFPASYQKGMKCTVLVGLIPGGDVVSARITQSSGNKAFDSSVERAVYKASPLPVPKSDSNLFDHFRQVELVFDPNA